MTGTEPWRPRYVLRRLFCAAVDWTEGDAVAWLFPLQGRVRYWVGDHLSILGWQAHGTRLFRWLNEPKGGRCTHTAQEMTDEINADPEEVASLLRARADVAAGRVIWDDEQPGGVHQTWTCDTKTNSDFTGPSA